MEDEDLDASGMIDDYENMEDEELDASGMIDDFGCIDADAYYDEDAGDYGDVGLVDKKKDASCGSAADAGNEKENSRKRKNPSCITNVKSGDKSKMTNSEKEEPPIAVTQIGKKYYEPKVFCEICKFNKLSLPFIEKHLYGRVHKEMYWRKERDEKEVKDNVEVKDNSDADAKVESGKGADSGLSERDGCEDGASEAKKARLDDDSLKVTSESGGQTPITVAQEESAPNLVQERQEKALRETFLMEKLSETKRVVVGLNYVREIGRFGGRCGGVFVCTLCEQTNWESGMAYHIASYKHLEKYLSKHSIAYQQKIHHTDTYQTEDLAALYGKKAEESDGRGAIIIDHDKQLFGRFISKKPRKNPNRKRVNKLREQYIEQELMKLNAKKKLAVLGLSYLKEVGRPEFCRGGVYRCTLCKEHLEEELVPRHVIGRRHLLKYLRAHHPRFKRNCWRWFKIDYKMLSKKEGRELEEKDGRGAIVIEHNQEWLHKIANEIPSVAEALRMEKEKNEWTHDKIGTMETKLFLSDLPHTGINPATYDLRQYFGKYGNIIDCCVPNSEFPNSESDRQSKQIFGFITYATTEMAKRALDDSPHVMNGHEINVKWNAENRNCRLYIGGLSLETNADSLRKYFEEYGEVLACFVPPHYGNIEISGRCGFVVYEDAETAQAALEAAPHVIDGTEVYTKLHLETFSNYQTGTPLKENPQVEGTCKTCNLSFLDIVDLIEHYESETHTQFPDLVRMWKKSKDIYMEKKNKKKEIQDGCVDSMDQELRAEMEEEKMNQDAMEQDEEDEEVDQDTGCTIRINHLAYRDTPDVLREYFGKYGEVVFCRTYSRRVKAGQRFFGLISFEYAAIADFVLKDGPHFIRNKEVLVTIKKSAFYPKGGKDVKKKKVPTATLR